MTLLVGIGAALAALSPAQARAQAAPRTGTAAQTSEARSFVADLPVPGGVTDLLAAARLAPAPRAIALLNLIRALHIRTNAAGDELASAEAVRARLESKTLGPPTPADTVPLPLPADIWVNAVFKGAVKREGLLGGILADRNASFLYYGLMSLDDSTLAFLAKRPQLVADIYQQAAGIFATFGRSIRIGNDTLALPGGDAVVPLWERIVGEVVAQPDRFILTVLTKDAGRCAYVLDTIAHLEPAQQAFAFGSAQPAGKREDAFRSLYAAVVAFEPLSWRLLDKPFARRTVDPALILIQVAAAADGRMAPPRGADFWRPVLEGNPAGCGRAGGTGADVDASWLLTRVLTVDAEANRQRLNTIIFGQRVFASISDGEAPAACAALARFPRYAGLFAALREIGFSRPRDYVAALTFADALGTADTRPTVLSLAQVQAILAVLERVAAVSPSNRQTAVDLALSLFTLPAGRAGRPGEALTLPPGHFGEWMHTVLLSRVCRREESTDTCLEELVSGLRAEGRPQPAIEWEGQSYRVDPAAGFRTRLTRVRRRQHGTALDAAMMLVRVGLALRDEAFTEAASAQQAADLKYAAGKLDSTTPLFGADISSAASTLTATAAKLVSAHKKVPTASVDVLTVADAVVADALASFAYAMAIGDADAAFLLVDDPARRHDFAVGMTKERTVTRSWQLAEEVRQSSGWAIQGSLAGLSRACALSWQRRLSIEAIDVHPTLDERDLHGFPETAASLNPFDLTDAARSDLAAATARGRAAVADLVHDPDAFMARMTAVGVSEWRSRGALWTVQRKAGNATDMFSLVELMRLGGPALPREQLDPWGVPASRLDGCLRPRLPLNHAWEDLGGRQAGLLSSHTADLNLRVTAWLDESKLPGSLLPGILAFATWDLVTTSEPVDNDDWFAVVRAAQAVPADRLADYVSALTADGTLTPIK